MPFSNRLTYILDHLAAFPPGFLQAWVKLHPEETRYELLASLFKTEDTKLQPTQSSREQSAQNPSLGSRIHRQTSLPTGATRQVGDVVYELLPSVGGTGQRRWTRRTPRTPRTQGSRTREGVRRHPGSGWRRLRDIWDKVGVGEIISSENRSRLSHDLSPRVDDAWILWFPGDEPFRGERIELHHVQGSPIVIPLPASRHREAHMPGGPRRNPGGPGRSG